MKINKSKIRKIIKEELSRLKEETNDTSSLDVSDYRGEYGNRNHTTRAVYGMIPIEDLLQVKGRNNEHEAFVYDSATKTYSRNPDGAHSDRYSQEEWDKLVDSIKTEGFEADKAIHIVSDPDIGPKVYEGNHRIRAAHEAGLTHIPTTIKYYGHSERDYRVSSIEPPANS